MGNTTGLTTTKTKNQNPNNCYTTLPTFIINCLVWLKIICQYSPFKKKRGGGSVYWIYHEWSRTQWNLEYLDYQEIEFFKFILYWVLTVVVLIGSTQGASVVSVEKKKKVCLYWFSFSELYQVEFYPIGTETLDNTNTTQIVVRISCYLRCVSLL